MSFSAVRIKNQDRRRPVHIETVKPRRVLLDVRLDRDKAFIDEPGNALI